MPIQLNNCTFGYRKGHPVLEGLTAELPAGRTVLLGPNGAGKSTLLSLAASVLTPQVGSVEFDGLNPAHGSQGRAYRQAVGFLPQDVKPMPGLRVREQVAYAGWLKGLSRGQAWQEARVALDRVGLAKLARRRSHALSGGQLRRLGIAQTLVHRARMMLLDEPTAGLDPEQRLNFTELMCELAEGAHKVDFVVSTHQTVGMSSAYDHVLVLHDGQVKYQGSVASFLEAADPAAAPDIRIESAYARVIRGGA